MKTPVRFPPSFVDLPCLGVFIVVIIAVHFLAVHVIVHARLVTTARQGTCRPFSSTVH